MVSILVPVYNEERILEENIKKLKKYLDENLEKKYRLIIVDSNSKDKTKSISKKLVKKFKNVSYINVDSLGKGGKIKKVTLSLNDDYFAFIDADLPIKLDKFLEILNIVLNKKADLAIVLRVKSRRPLLRRLASRAYYCIARLFLGIMVKDIFAGAKAWNKKIKEKIWPKVKDEKWFFDTELIYYTIKNGYKINEVPITWEDERKDSKFSIIKGGSYIGISLIKFIFCKQK